ncbi:MAG: hypothetical protein WD895_06575 [Acidimicrobiia bacterium]
MTNEHIFPDWLSEWFQTEGVTQFSFKTSLWGDRTTSRMDFQVKRFCETCNGVWMGEMETAVKPLLTTMIRNTNQRSILPTGQIHLARWGFKTMLTLMAAAPQDRIPPLDVYRGFRRWQTPPTIVWIGYAPDDLSVRFSATTMTADDTGAEIHQALLLVGHFFIGAMYASDPSVGIQVNFNPESYVNIWPVRSPVLWPPATHIDADRLFAQLS